jgi:uncharacterized membrane protein YGL010W
VARTTTWQHSSSSIGEIITGAERALHAGAIDIRDEQLHSAFPIVAAPLIILLLARLTIVVALLATPVLTALVLLLLARHIAAALLLAGLALVVVLLVLFLVGHFRFSAAAPRDNANGPRQFRRGASDRHS